MARRFQYKSLSYVPLVNTTPEVFIPVFSQSPVSIVIPVRFQYKSNFTPLSSIANAPEVTVDSWLGNTQLPVRRQNRNYQFPAHFANETLFVPALDSWSNEAEIPVRKKNTNYLHDGFFFDPSPIANPEEVTLDKWFSDSRTPSQKRNTSHLNQGFFFDSNPIPNAEDVTLDKWKSEQGNPILQKARRFLSSIFEPVYFETSTLDKWFAPTSQPTRRKPQVNQGISSYVEPVTFTPETFVPVFSQSPVHIVVPVRFQYKAHFPDLRSLTAPENVTVDKWFAPTQQPVRRKVQAPLQRTFYTERGIVEIVSLDKWIQPAQIPVRQKRFTAPAQFEPVFFNPFISLDKWYVPTQQPVRTIPTRRYMWPAYPALVEFEVPPFWFEKFEPQADPFTDKFAPATDTFTDKFPTASDPFTDKLYNGSDNWTDNLTSGNDGWIDKY